MSAWSSGILPWVKLYSIIGYQVATNFVWEYYAFRGSRLSVSFANKCSKIYLYHNVRGKFIRVFPFGSYYTFFFFFLQWRAKLLLSLVDIGSECCDYCWPLTVQSYVMLHLSKLSDIRDCERVKNTSYYNYSLNAPSMVLLGL